MAKASGRGGYQKTKEQASMVERREIRNIALADVKSSRCGWRGCEETVERKGLPAGWSALIVHNTPIETVMRLATVESARTPVLVLNRMKWRHDKVLCPQHTKALDELLAIGTGGADPLSETDGTA
jgi:hypothetical protein